MYYVPVFHLKSMLNNFESDKSITPMNAAVMPVMTITTKVELINSCLVDQETLVNSVLTSLRKFTLLFNIFISGLL